jgi:hypothetical protein
MNKEIQWNLVNSGLAGALVLLGSFSTGNITMQSFSFALIASLAVAVTQFKDYWTKEEEEYRKKCPNRKKLFSFI